MRPIRTAVLLVIALTVGALIAYVDTRPHWDDAGITAGVVFLASLALSSIRPRLALPIAVAVGGWIPLLEMTRDGNAGSLIALAIAFIGALCGVGLRHLIAPSGHHPAPGR